VLQVDGAHYASAAHERHREKGLVAVFGEFVEELEARVVRGFFGDGDGRVVFGNPSGDALTDAKFEAIDDIGMRVFGCAEDEMLTLQYVNQAGIAFHEAGCEFDYLIQNFVKTVRRCEAAANLMKKVYG